MLSNHESKSNRLDPPHDLMLASAHDSSVVERSAPWLSMAGRDPATSNDQVDRQTNELLSYVQQQNDEIDARQSELNARLAQLDNELRAARLRSGLDNGSDLLEEDHVHEDNAAGQTELTKHDSAKVEKTSPSLPVSDAPSVALDEDGFVAKQSRYDTSGLAANPTGLHVVPQHSKDGPRNASQTSHETLKSPSPSVNQLHQTQADSDLRAIATSLDASEIESERRLLAERKLELDRRKAMLQRMHDETQSLHREALEMRLVTEQLWIEISGKAPAEHVTELLNTLRSRLHERYAEEQKSIDADRAELTNVQRTIERKQEEIREQSRRLQEWVESRHDELKSIASEIDARSMMLDRREHRMQDELSKWEAQRRAYHKQLGSLLGKLDIADLQTED